MKIETVQVPNDDERFKWLDKVATWMDSRFVIPGTKIRFGLDPIITFFPVAGDVTTILISSMLVYQMHQYGASRKLVIKMMGNVLLDAVLGAIPVIGVVFDLAYKANERNVKLLKEHYLEGKHQGSGTWIIVSILLGIILLVIGILHLFWLLLDSLFGFFQ